PRTSPRGRGRRDPRGAAADARSAPAAVPGVAAVVDRRGRRPRAGRDPRRPRSGVGRGRRADHRPAAGGPAAGPAHARGHDGLRDDARAGLRPAPVPARRGGEPRAGAQRQGRGHYPETALPGEVGNVAIAGHRNTYGRVFEDIARLEAGDPIVVETADAFYVYETTESLIVQPEDVEVIAPTPGRPGVEPTERMLTLTACHPMYSARERIIVHAEFSYWTKRSDGIPEALAQDADAGTEES